MEGKIKWYNWKKGYGFIEGDDGKSYFLHRSQVHESMNLKENVRVSFKPITTEKGLQATEFDLTGEEDV